MTNPEKGKHAKLKQGITAAAFLVPTVLTASAVAMTVGAYEPLVFDPSAITQTARAEAQELNTAEATGEKTSAEPTTDANYSASDYGIDASNLKDGTYRGSAYGFKSTITVEVTISGGKITAINIVSEGDDASYFNRAKAVINSVLSAQSTSVDTVSGATYSSKGILMAIKNALTQAAGGTPTATTATTPANSSSSKGSPATVDEVPEGVMKDGVYVGKGMGYNDYIRIAVTITDGKIAGIKLVDEDDDEPYFTNASVVMDRVLKAQSTSVDTVSGATYSSKGILAAVADALTQAVNAAKGEETPVEPDPEPEPEPTPDPTPTPDPDPEPSTETQYADGTFTGTALCLEPGEDARFDPYYVQVSVVIQDGKVSTISNIAGVSGGSYVYNADDNESYLNWAIDGRTFRGTAYVGVKNQLLQGTSPSNIVVVSRATYSSKAIATAYQSALDQSAAAYKAAHAGDAAAGTDAAGTDASAAGGDANA